MTFPKAQKGTRGEVAGALDQPFSSRLLQKNHNPSRLTYLSS